ncbi:MAG: glycosyltransferase family 2 protein [Ruminococcaceae bacterium]|nr:glycosyltransferase family 2 protein [Oscillospiraceae bacterium]MBQ7120290.1 glycosyltransferase family 2 protein [Oscillospiraceae bacterium]
MERNLISIVVPCYNEEKAIPFFLEEIRKTTSEMIEKYDVDFEFLFVDDGSRDKTAALLRTYAKENTDVKYVIFSRNFGKEAALYAGLEKARGDFVVVMDADLQDPPSMLPEMYEAVMTDEYDAAAARRVDRKGEPPIRSFFARKFYKIINKISQTEIVDGARDYRMMSRRMVDAILSMSEYNRFSKGIFSWVGFNTKWLEYKNTERVAGETKWSFWKLFKYSIDGIVAFSTAPLAISSFLGIILCFISCIMAGFVVVKTLAFGDPVAGYPSMVCIILFLSGVILLSLGIQGQYLAKTYMETKRRPIYISREDNCDG